MTTGAANAISQNPDIANELLSNDGWKWRRWLLFGIVGFFSAMLGFIIVHGVDTPLNQQTVIAFTGAIMSLGMAYIFGAAWDDKNKRAYLNHEAPQN